ncbi:DUF2946 family protein [Immundisolibacter sp.]|uniref:DUF2946 family protein n=1 Tax=Immundisolibacter sp. TaxID=1934948 RepID=UPI00356B2E41
MSELPVTPAWSPGQPLAGWLRLTGRGTWLIRDAAVEHPSLRAHLNRHYQRDAQGRYFVQNGAQVVFVRLDYAPYTVHVAADGSLVAHTGQPAGAVQAACLDEAGVLTLLTELGAARADEATLEYFADRVRHADDQPADETALSALMHGGADTPALILDLPQGRVPLTRCASNDLPRAFGFVRDPQQQYGAEAPA